MQQAVGDAHSGQAFEQGLPPRTQFEAALKQALKHYARPDLLYANPLLDCLLVRVVCRSQADKALRVARLRELIKRHSNTLAEAKKTKPYQQVLESTYLRPAQNQAAAARELGMSFSSYRRYLADAVHLLTAHLWMAELQQREQNLVQKVTSQSH